MVSRCERDLRKFFQAIVNNKATVPIVYGVPLLLIFAAFAIMIYVSSLPGYANLTFVNRSDQNIADICLSSDRPFASIKDLKANARKELKFKSDRTTSLNVTVRFNNGTILKAKDLIYLMRPFVLDEEINIYKDKILIRDLPSAPNIPKVK